MKKSREKCVFVLVPQQCVTQSVTCSASCPPARLCSLTVISVDQSTEGGSEEKKMEGRRAASQSRSSSRNPTGWKYVVGIRSRMLSSPDSSSLLSVRPSSRLLTDLSCVPSTAQITRSDAISDGFLTLIKAVK